VEPVSAFWWIEWVKQEGFWLTAWRTPCSPADAEGRLSTHQSAPWDGTSLNQGLHALSMWAQAAKEEHHCHGSP